MKGTSPTINRVGFAEKDQQGDIEIRLPPGDSPDRRSDPIKVPVPEGEKQMREPVCLAHLPAGEEANVVRLLSPTMAEAWDAMPQEFTIDDLMRVTSIGTAYRMRNRLSSLGLEVRTGVYAKMKPDSDQVRVLGSAWSKYWIFRNRVVSVENSAGFTEKELLLHIKHDVLKAEGELEHRGRAIQAFENMERLPAGKRERIPESVRLFVWQRDGGKCVKCGSREMLEFDHIIPVAKRGSNTERNVQLLCEQCNRQKGKNLC